MIIQTRLKEQSIYDINDLTGVSKLCDWFINYNNFINITNTNNPKYIFIHAMYGNLTIEYFINNYLGLISKDCVLIIASSDLTFPYNKYERRELYKFVHYDINNVMILINNTYIKKIYVENLDTRNFKLIPIPLGLTNNINNIITNEKSIMCFCCHRLYNTYNTYINQFNDRKYVTDLCLDYWNDIVIYKNKLEHNEYIEYLCKSAFIICVHGGGLDLCPKLFEALICKCIPIICKYKDNDVPLYDIYENMPVVIIDDWNPESITEEKLQIWYDKYSPLIDNFSIENLYVDKFINFNEIIHL